MNDNQFKILLEEVRKTKALASQAKEATDKLESKWESDREDFSDFTLRLKKLEDGFDELRSIIISLPKETRDQVKTAMKPMEKETKDLKDALEETEVPVKVIQQVKEQKKPWWEKIFRL